MEETSTPHLEENDGESILDETGTINADDSNTEAM